MIDQRTIFEIHRLAHEGFSLRKIAGTLGIARRTAQKYLDEPNPPRPRWRRPSLLDPFHDEIERLLQIDPTASAVVIRQCLEVQGFHEGLSLLRQHLRQVRAHKTPQPTIRFETPPGHQCQVDWGHFGALTYGNTARKLYCLAGLKGIVACSTSNLPIRSGKRPCTSASSMPFTSFRYPQGTCP
jgi:transposase